jgi:hypothetical protein
VTGTGSGRPGALRGFSFRHAIRIA